MPLKTHWEEQPSLNLTPMIDIVFLLIIFFMVGTKFTELEQKIPVSVPQVKQTGTLTEAPQRRVINVHRDGSISLDGEAMDQPGLYDRLNGAVKEYRDLGVIVRGDAEANYQEVAEVVATCHALEILDIYMSVKKRR